MFQTILNSEIVYSELQSTLNLKTIYKLLIQQIVTKDPFDKLRLGWSLFLKRITNMYKLWSIYALVSANRPLYTVTKLHEAFFSRVISIGISFFLKLRKIDANTSNTKQYKGILICLRLNLHMNQGILGIFWYICMTPEHTVSFWSSLKISASCFDCVPHSNSLGRFFCVHKQLSTSNNTLSLTAFFLVTSFQ